MIFLICLEDLHSLEAPTSFVFQLQLEGGSNPLSFSSYNLREAPTPQFSGYNPLCSPATTGRWLQPPILAPSSHPEVEVELWNHYHTITVIYTVVNLYQ
jgi:hypothetical protein